MNGGLASKPGARTPGRAGPRTRWSASSSAESFSTTGA